MSLSWTDDDDDEEGGHWEKDPDDPNYEIFIPDDDGDDVAEGDDADEEPAFV